jgi:hypothetical protein
MTLATRTFVSAIVLSLAATAQAGDAYYNIPVQELKIVEGSLPKRERVDWRAYVKLERMQPSAALNGPGEVYVAGRLVPGEAGWGPGAIPPAVGAPRPPGVQERDPIGPGLRLLARAEAGKDLAGLIVVPNSDLSAMVALRFTVPASAAKPEAKEAFYEGKINHYQQLLGRQIPGGAWFRHQVRLAEAEIHRPINEVPRTTVPWMGPRDDLSRTYELFTGGRALSENLQLDRALPAPRAGETPVKVDSIPGITIQEIDWKPLLGDAKPALDPLAALIPADQHAVFFPSFQAAVAVADETSRHDTPVLRWAQPRSEDAGVVRRYEQQLGLTMSTIARLVGPALVKSVALTGSDPYFPSGTDVAVLFETPHPDVLEKLLLARIALATAGRGAKSESSSIAITQSGNTSRGSDEIPFQGFSSPDRSVSSYVARLPGAVVVSNSKYQLGCLLEVQVGRKKPISKLPEYTFFRNRYKLGDPEETALAFLSDPTIRRWCSARWRIGDSRRTRAAALLAELQASQLPALAGKTVQPGPIHTDLPATGCGQIALEPGGVRSSTYGTLAFLTPIAEVHLDELIEDMTRFDAVSQAEAQAYGLWRDGYQRNWNWAFDPIALRLSLGKKQAAADLSVMPLIAATEYREIISISQGGRFGPSDGDPHEALAQLILAINRQSPMVGSAENLAAMVGQRISLGWIGSSVSAYADDDPFWKELAAVKEDQVDKFMEKNAGRLPVAVRIDVSNPLRLAAFLTAARAFIEQTSPGLTFWESRKYKDQPYVRITPAKGGRGVPQEMENLAIYYTTVGGALTVTLSESVLRRAIDRATPPAASGKEAGGEGKFLPSPDQPAVGARRGAGGEGAEEVAAIPAPWLGSNAALRVDHRILEVANALGRRHYEDLMQTQCWDNLPILNEWKRLYPERDPVEVHRTVWGVELVCPGGGKYVWNAKLLTMESTVYGCPAAPKVGPPAPPVLGGFTAADFGLTLENQGLRARAALQRPAQH